MNDLIEDLYPLSPLQQGMFFHDLQAEGEGLYLNQLVCELRGPLHLDAFERAWKQVVALHPILRTAVEWEDVEEPLQVVLRDVEVPFRVRRLERRSGRRASGADRGVSRERSEARVRPCRPALVSPCTPAHRRRPAPLRLQPSPPAARWLVDADDAQAGLRRVRRSAPGPDAGARSAATVSRLHRVAPGPAARGSRASLAARPRRLLGADAPPDGRGASIDAVGAHRPCAHPGRPCHRGARRADPP